MQLGLLEVKLTLFRVLSKFRFAACPETQVRAMTGAGVILVPGGVSDFVWGLAASS